MGRTTALLTLAATLAAAAAPASAAAPTAVHATTAAAPTAPHATATAATPTPPALGAARLEGQFLLAGRITVAKLVPGERAGQTVSRTWTFNPACAAGACATIQLQRQRAKGTDRVTLHRSKPGYYVGRGSFFAPLRCGKRVYTNGAAVPFTITVRVTAAPQTPPAFVASRVTATYVNQSRRNLTPCVGVLGHDAATYHGHLLLGPQPTGGAGA